MSYKAFAKHFTHRTKRRHEFVKITGLVEKAIEESGIKTGSVICQTHHTTCGMWVNEDEANLIGADNMAYLCDLKKVLDRFASPDHEYNHDDIKDARNPEGKRDTHLCEADENGVINECHNGHSHAQSLIIPHSVTMVVDNGKLIKGKWQEIMLVELDHDRERNFSILVQGLTE